jgi:hypothetical protein
VATPWRDPTGPLLRLAKAFALDTTKLPLGESRQKLTYSDENFEAAKLTSPQRLEELAGALQAAKAHYGPALTFRLEVGGSVLLDLGAAIDDFYEKLEDIQYLEVYLKVEKAALLSHWNLTDPAVATCLYLFPEVLQRALTEPLTDLDDGPKALFADSEKLVIFVPARNVALEGDLLAIVGGDALERPRNSTSPNADAVKAVYTKARGELKWIHFELKRLTPLHLKIDGTASQGDDIAAAVYGQLLICSLLYTANQSWSSKSGWESTFASQTSAVKIEIPDAKTIGEMLRAESADDLSSPAKVIADKVTWIYEDLSQAADRLTVAQNAIVEALEDSDSSTACRLLIRRAADITNRIDWAWQAFISGKLQTYFGQVKQLIETIDSTTKSYNEQVQTFTKTLIDNMLAAVAVIVGSFIAAMFKSPFQSSVFLFGTGAYVLYLLIFPIGVGLSSTWQRFCESRKDFRNRILYFSRGVPSEQVKVIVGSTVDDRERWFERWFAVTTALYLTAALCLLVVAVLVTAAIVVRRGLRP